MSQIFKIFDSAACFSKNGCEKLVKSLTRRYTAQTLLFTPDKKFDLVDLWHKLTTFSPAEPSSSSSARRLLLLRLLRTLTTTPITATKIRTATATATVGISQFEILTIVVRSDPALSPCNHIARRIKSSSVTLVGPYDEEGDAVKKFTLFIGTDELSSSLNVPLFSSNVPLLLLLSAIGRKISPLLFFDTSRCRMRTYCTDVLKFTTKNKKLTVEDMKKGAKEMIGLRNSRPQKNAKPKPPAIPMINIKMAKAAMAPLELLTTSTTTVPLPEHTLEIVLSTL
uniref:Uncharacterized protein n=1 Tax=Romanomermis culicivorax TaxID=13658 RepID=A0A915IPW7_ROMCU